MRGIAWIAAAWLALTGCSPPDAVQKEQAPALPRKAPDVFQVKLDTSKGAIVIEVHKDWAPIGVDRLYALVKTGYYDGNRFFRVTRGYAQFGINGDPQTNGLWSTAYLPDDRVQQSNVKSAVTFAHLGANNRTTQLFFNLRDNKDLDKRGFAPIGKVTSGMDVVESLYSGYGDVPPRGQGPDPSQIATQGNAYLESRFPRLDYIRKASIQ